MGRLVIVSNRVPAVRDRAQPAGGLAVALRDAVQGQECLWFGWSGQQIGGDRNEASAAGAQEKEDHPVSIDVATKKSNELLAQSYAALYNIPITGLRLFSVYGPGGRPDMF